MDGERALADQLVRRRDRPGAVERLCAAHPEVPRAIEAALDAGRNRYGDLLHEPRDFAEAVWPLVARSWRREARVAPLPLADAFTTLAESGFLADLYLAVGAQEDGARARDACCRAHPALDARAALWHEEAVTLWPEVRLDRGDFGIKVLGSALHHLLRAAPLGVAGALSPMAEIVRLLPERLERRGAPPALFLTLAVARGDTAAERHFASRYGGVLADHLRRQGVGPDRRGAAARAPDRGLPPGLHLLRSREPGGVALERGRERARGPRAAAARPLAGPARRAAGSRTGGIARGV